MREAFVVKAPSHHALRALNYTPEIERFKTHHGLPFVRLGDLLRSMGPAYGSVFTRIDCDPCGGVELITQGDMFATEPDGRIIRLDSMTNPERHRVRRWQVLIAGAGTLGENELYGRSIIADSRLVGRFVGPHAMVLTFAEEGEILNLYTYAFLCTKIGIRAIRSTSYGTKILGLRKDMLSQLPVPLADDAIVRRVAALVRETVAQRERYATALSVARRVVNDLPEMQEAHAMCAERRARTTLWPGALPTLSAWNYASTGGALAMLSGRWPGRVRDLVAPDGLFNGPRFARIECDPPHGINFYSQRDLFMMRPAPQRIVRPSIPDRQLFVDSECILAGSHGQMSEGSLFGRIELASFGAHSVGLTQDILRIHPRPGCREVLFGFLSTAVGQRLFKSTAVGTSIPSVRLDLLANLPVPDLDVARLRSVRAAVEEGIMSRNAATHAEAEAIRIVEKEVLPRWLA